VHQRLQALEQQQHTERQRMMSVLASCREHCSHAEEKCSWRANPRALWGPSCSSGAGDPPHMTADAPQASRAQQGKGEAGPAPASPSVAGSGEGQPPSRATAPSSTDRGLPGSLHSRAAGPARGPSESRAAPALAPALAVPAAVAGSSQAMRGSHAASSALSYRDACTRPAPEAPGSGDPPPGPSPSAPPGHRHSGTGAQDGAPAQASSGSAGEAELLPLAGRSRSEQHSEVGAEAAPREGPSEAPPAEEGKGHRRALSLELNGDALRGQPRARVPH